MTSSPRSEAFVVSEIFPPTVGGSGELLRNLYGRFSRTDVRVLANQRDDVPTEYRAGSIEIVREPMTSSQWGLANRQALAFHLHRVRRLRALARPKPTIIHCARALPEGVSAWMNRCIGGPSYVCWAHGEDIALADTSGELRWLSKRVLNGAAAVIANSGNTATMVRKLGVPDAKVHIVYPGIDTDRFQPDVAGAEELRARLASPDELVLLTVGRLQRRKGHDTMLHAVARLRDSGRKLRYVVVGDGDERARLEGLVVELGIGSVVSFAGTVASDELPRYYAACDVFCHPNRVDGLDIEGFGMVFLEAAAAGRAVIGGDSGGVPEAVERDVTGLLVSGTDVDELVAAIAVLGDDPERRRTMGLAGRDRAMRKFSWTHAARSVEAVHERALGRTTAP